MSVRMKCLSGTIACAIVALSFVSCGAADGTDGQEEDARDGYYELTLKTPESTKVQLDRLVRDRDLSPQAIYRVTSSGYMSFDESDWVDKIEYKVYDIPVTAMPEYGEFRNLIADINSAIWKIKATLRGHDELAFRLINIADKSEFKGIKAIDQSVAHQLVVYRNLILLKRLVVNSLNRFVRERTGVDKFDHYKISLESYRKKLTSLCSDFEKIRQKAMQVARDIEAQLQDADKDKKGKK